MALPLRDTDLPLDQAVDLLTQYGVIGLSCTSSPSLQYENKLKKYLSEKGVNISIYLVSYEFPNEGRHYFIFDTGKFEGIEVAEIERQIRGKFSNSSSDE